MQHTDKQCWKYTTTTKSNKTQERLWTRNLKNQQQSNIKHQNRRRISIPRWKNWRVREWSNKKKAGNEVNAAEQPLIELFGPKRKWKEKEERGGWWSEAKQWPCVGLRLEQQKAQESKKLVASWAAHSKWIACLMNVIVGWIKREKKRKKKWGKGRKKGKWFIGMGIEYILESFLKWNGGSGSAVARRY